MQKWVRYGVDTAVSKVEPDCAPSSIDVRIAATSEVVKRVGRKRHAMALDVHANQLRVDRARVAVSGRDRSGPKYSPRTP